MKQEYLNDIRRKLCGETFGEKKLKPDFDILYYFDKTYQNYNFFVQANLHGLLCYYLKTYIAQKKMLVVIFT